LAPFLAKMDLGVYPQLSAGIFLEKEPYAEEARLISVLGASFADCDVGNTFVMSSSSFTIFTPSSYFLAYLPRTPPEKSYSFFIF